MTFRKSSRRERAPRPHTAQSSALPSRKDIIEYLNAADGPAVRRDIARAFGVKGPARADLRALLKEMEADGAINLGGGKRISQPGKLPPVTPIDIVGVTHDGDLECAPVSWDENGEPPMIRIDERRAAKFKPAVGVGDRVLARLKPNGERAYSAEIMKQIGKGAHRFLAVFTKERRGAIAEPVDRRARDYFIIERGDEGGAKDGDLIWIETKNARGYGPKKARVRKIEGHVDDQNAFSTIALANHNIPTEFPLAVSKEAQKARLPGVQDRVDLRKTMLFTIDPADAKDHDDACFAEPDTDPDNPGGFRVIVAIADVSYFVRPGSALDKEAVNRGNSVYLPDRVVPMLPERLSNDLCSLRQGEDRPCLAVEMIIKANGVKKSHRFMRAIMRSAAKLSYEDAQKIRDGGHAGKDIKQAVNALFDAFEARWKERTKRAPLDLDLPERKVILNKKGEVTDVVKRERIDAHRVIEEFMILANVAAAETLERAGLEQIYRVHDQPEEESLEGVRDYLETLDYSLVKSGAVKPANFNQLLKIADSRGEKEMVSQVVLRAQRQAIYDTDNRGHFGLNLAHYAHFTSPIRRYADLTVHRALVTAARLGEGGQTKEESGKLSDIAQQISDFERRAIAAEREAKDRYLTEFLATKEGVEFEARIRGMTKYGLFVMLEESGADGFIPMRSIGWERYRFEETHHRVVGESTGGVFRLGQDVRVRLEEAVPLTGSLRFEMVSEPEKGLSKPARKAGSKKRAPAKRKTAARKKTPTRKANAPAKKRTTNKTGAKPAAQKKKASTNKAAKPVAKKKRKTRSNAKSRQG